MATVKLPKRSILDELAEQKDRIIEEGNLYLAYIYSSLTRQPKRIYRFEELISEFKTLTLSVDREVYFRGISKDGSGRKNIIRTTNFSLVKPLAKVVSLFRTYKSIEFHREFPKKATV
jgi:hypothetical protein